MKFGFSPPVSGPFAKPEILTRIACEGEAMGYDYASISDHVVIPKAISARYPYSETGEFPSQGQGDRYEQLAVLAFLAGKTSRLKLVTSVTVVPHRPAVLLAKMLATIDVLSEGRLVFGIGAGWLKEEFEALGLPPYAERGRVTDEYLLACRELWTKDEPRFEGRFVKFADILFAPKPVQKPHPPIWVGGESPAALRRAASLGQGWYPIGTNPQHPLDSLKRLESGIARLKALARERGREREEIALAYRVASWGKALPEKAADGERRLFAGGPREIAEDLRALEALGVGHADFAFAGESPEAILALMRRFFEEVLARL